MTYESGFETSYWEVLVVYFDDILIYSKTEATHYNHVHEVLKFLLANKLYVNLKK